MTPAAGDARPLAGRRVLVTRPRAQAQELVDHLVKSGAQVIVAPTIRTVPPEDRDPLLEAAKDAARFDWIVFSSANAVDAFLAAVADTAGSLSRVKVCAVGSKTAAHLAERGIPVDLVPGEFRAEAVVEALTARGAVAGLRVLVPRADIGRDVIANGLRAAGALVTDVVAYRTVADEPDADAPDIRQALATHCIDVVTFTSGSAVRSFVQIYGNDAAALLRQTTVAVIGPVTADAARELGIRVDVQPEAYTTAAMVEALVAHFTRR